LFDVYETNGASFQYEPMGRHLAPFINDVTISIFMEPSGGRNVEREVERAMRLFGRDHIDMVRSIAVTTKDPTWAYWDSLFKLKEKGYIRAVGMPIHFAKELDVVLQEKVPLDYVVVPYNFYHNLLYTGVFTDDFRPLATRLREKGCGIVSMKPFGSDWFVNPLIKAAKHLDETGEISLPQAALKWIVNSDMKPDVTLGGMYTLDHVYEDVPAFYNTKMTPEETKLLDKLCKLAKVGSSAWLPDYYRFLDQWAPDRPENGTNSGRILG
jgi:aryl-alcohol dehydrogenase-like predicted oxidoreductase